MLSPGTVVGGYRVEAILGRGGMGVVYSARHTGSDRRVALKLLAPELSSDPEFVARFEREGRLQASLDHPHVVTVYDAGTSEHGLYLAMQLIPGPTLAALESQQAVDGARAVHMLGQVAEALDAAHDAGLVHRDVKPQNVLIGEDDAAYLGDFGLTRLGGATNLTKPEKLMGTVAYLAPEVIHGGDALPASDRYALAAMAFECLTGTAVYPRQADAAILYAHTHEPPPRASRRRSELPEALDGVLERGLAKDPGKRPESARALVHDIRAALGSAGRSPLGPPPPPGAAALAGPTLQPLAPGAPPPSGRARARTLAPWMLAAALAGACVATAVALLVSGDGGTSSGPGVPPPLPGATVLGSDLSEPGQTVDCRAHRVRPLSPGCTIVQSALPGRQIVVPEDGVIRRWSVRSARGELALAVARPRGNKAGQVARSRNEFASNSAATSFKTDIPVKRGDLVGLVVVGGSGVGARSGVDGATTTRWIPRLADDRAPDLESGTGFDRELLLRVDYVPGGEPKLPHQVSGAAAAKLPAGDVQYRHKLKFGDGRPVEVDIVRVGHHFALDEIEGGKRTARVDVPDFIPGSASGVGGSFDDHEVYTEQGVPEQLGVYLEYRNEESQRILSHFYAVYPHQFQFID